MKKSTLATVLTPAAPTTHSGSSAELSLPEVNLTSRPVTPLPFKPAPSTPQNPTPSTFSYLPPTTEKAGFLKYRTLNPALLQPGTRPPFPGPMQFPHPRLSTPYTSALRAPLSFIWIGPHEAAAFLRTGLKEVLSSGSHGCWHHTLQTNMLPECRLPI